MWNPVTIYQHSKLDMTLKKQNIHCANVPLNDSDCFIPLNDSNCFMGYEKIYYCETTCLRGMDNNSRSIGFKKFEAWQFSMK